jgi:pyruvate-formate lyase-activating enzyme
MGCLSLQDDSQIRSSQDRIDFTPSPEEICEVALHHIHHTPKAIVSFGQGCEGDPLMAARVIVPAIRLIRSKTAAGTIHMNTNGSRPQQLKKMFEAGLDSVRISLNSVRKLCYSHYFKPQGYTFTDVMRSIDLALDLGKFVSINYLNMPGFTDSPEELAALQAFVLDHPIQMIQWRNLNYDPLRYLQAMGRVAPCGLPLGMPAALEQGRRAAPWILYGYFNPPKEHFPA